jgi:thermitase
MKTQFRPLLAACRRVGRSRPSFVQGLAATLTVTLGMLVLAGTAQAKPPTQWVDGELLIGFRAGVGPAGRFKLYRDHGATFVEDIGQNTRVVRVRVPGPALDALLRRLERRPEVKFVEKNYVFDPAFLANDPQFAYQWHLPRVRAPDAWDTTQGAGAVIAVLDSGVDASHPDLAGKLVAGYNTYSNNTTTSDQTGHGTEVAGAAGALTNNGEGIAGVAGAAPIMPVRVTDSTGRATSASLANGIVWAADHGARIVNLSFSNVAGNTTIRTAAEYAVNHGALVVAAAGNCGCVDSTPENPYILSVSATDEDDNVASFSSTGPFVDLSAPGNNILTTERFGLYGTVSGTSLSSPIVAGVAGLMLAAKPTLTPALISQLLEETAFGSGSYDQSFGYGRVDASAAVYAAANYTPLADTTSPTVAMTAPLDGAAVSGTAVVDVTADDNVGVVKVDLLVDGVHFVSDTTSPYSFAWDTTTLANGTHTLQAAASDAANNRASTAPISVTVFNTPPDTTPPVVSITAPAAGATVAGTATVSATATDNGGVAKVELYVDAVLYATDAAPPYAFNWNTTTSSNGSHTLQVAATDTAGNVANSTVTVTVANTVNHAPVAVNDAFSAPYRSQASYTAQVFAVLANDSDADGNLNPASVKIASSPNKGGTVTVKSNGTVSYTPKRGYKGVETFGYTVKDTLGATSNTATVTVTVQ